MPTKKVAKRGATERQQNPKKAKIFDPIVENCEVVVASLDGAAGLPKHCLDMLHAIAPLALATPAAERHECHNKIVHMISEVLAGIENDLAAQVAAADCRMREVEDEKAALHAAEKGAELSLAEKHDVVTAAAKRLEECTHPVELARGAVAEAEGAQAQGDALLRETTHAKEAYEAALSNHLRPLKDTSPETTGAMETHVSALVPLCETIGLDESLLKALPAAASRIAESRSMFDSMVFQQLEDELAKHIGTLTERLAGGAPAAAERAAAVQEARAGLARATEEQQAKAGELADAKAEHRGADAALKLAKQAARDLLPRLRDAEEARKTRSAGLEDFRRGPLATFQGLQSLALDVLKESGDVAAELGPQLHLDGAGEIAPPLVPPTGA